MRSHNVFLRAEIILDHSNTKHRCFRAEIHVRNIIYSPVKINVWFDGVLKARGS